MYRTYYSLNLNNNFIFILQKCNATEPENLSAYDDKENNIRINNHQDYSTSFDVSMVLKKKINYFNYTSIKPIFCPLQKCQKEASEDSGVSSRKSELSANINCELSAIEKIEHNSKDDINCSLDFSKR